jgi:hypothetical protein
MGRGEATELHGKPLDTFFLRQGLELRILLPLHPECRDYRHEPPYSFSLETKKRPFLLIN